MNELSQREKEILKFAGLSNDDIGKQLHLSRWTVQRYFADMFKKTGCTNRTQLVLRAIKDEVIKNVDIGFFDENGEYKPEICTVNLYKENAFTDAEIIEIIQAYAKERKENQELYKFIEFLRSKLC